MLKLEDKYTKIVIRDIWIMSLNFGDFRIFMSDKKPIRKTANVKNKILKFWSFRKKITKGTKKIKPDTGIL